MVVGQAGPRGLIVLRAVVPAQYALDDGRVPAQSLVLAVACASVKTFNLPSATFHRA